MLFSNPLKWSESAVGSWWRFAFAGICMSLFILNAVYMAAESGLRSGLCAAFLPVAWQFMHLYALRRLSSDLKDADRSASAA